MGFFRDIKYYFRGVKKINAFKKSFKKLKIRDLKKKRNEKIAFENFLNPKVSIIIPFFNQFDYTINCLHFLKSNLDNSIPFEIILIDDNSTDEFDFSIITGITIIKNSLNIGFLKSINVGIKASKSEFIYILNNDTEVQEKFLTELFYVFENFSNVGAVGSKLINPDGSIQEAGSVVLKNNKIRQIVKYKKAYSPEINYIYKVDYCSGCSLLFKKISDEGKINLFDETFAPAYFEETDFCFQLKFIQNKEIYYTPFSQVIHYNGVSYNNKSNQDETKIKKKKELFDINEKKFQEKWQKQLSLIYSKDIESRILELYENKSIVIFTGLIPEFDKDSGSNRLKEIIEAFLHLGFHVTIIKKHNYYQSNSYNEFYQRLGANVFYESNHGFGIKDYLKKYSQSTTISWFYNPDLFIEYYKTSLKYLPNAKLVYDMVDIHHLRFERAIELEPNNKSFKKKYKKYLFLEKKATDKSDFVIAISDFEKNYMAQFCNPNKIITISNIHYIKTEIAKTLGFEFRKDILFIGSSHTPNIDALYFLYNDIMPIVWEKLPDLKVNVIGNVKDKIKDINHPNFIFQGFVPDIEEYFFTNKLMVAPLRYGAGVKGKIGQAFEYYLPLVTTSIGAEGMRLVNKENALIDNDNVGFAKSIIELHSNKELWMKLQSNSESSLEPFSRKILKDKILSIINY